EWFDDPRQPDRQLGWIPVQSVGYARPVRRLMFRHRQSNGQLKHRTLLRGRLFTEAEATEARGLVLINDALARKYFPNEDPIGKQLAIQSRPPSPNPPVEIVGIRKMS
ncbi:MAG TPA: ABC transporter permease, partial [Blastocatellia bacterium]|nr:ABC transporter permease [Blastocatellia bacterium]